MDNEKLLNFYLSVRNTSFIVQKSIQEIEESTSPNKSDRLAGVLDFLTRMLDEDIKVVQS